jgi:homoserine O-acetyltransferase/O-succinyltransferase
MAALGSALVLLSAALGFSPRLRSGDLGDLALESGQHLLDARLTYRTLGTLAERRDNAVLVAPWFQGTSWQLLRQVGPGRLVDTRRFYVILVDAFGNGVASSPSNSVRQPDAQFPRFTIRDMVDAQHQLVTKILGIQRLHAVVGISMGGMQAFEWTVAYPSFISKAVSIVGSPQTQPDDAARWNQAMAWLRQPAWTRTTTQVRAWKPRSAVGELLVDPGNQYSQIQAILSHDIARNFGGSMERAAAARRADFLMVSTWQDREVNPKPAFEYARLGRAEVLELDGRCGHQAPSCEREALWRAVGTFLAR